ncbi:hypothetical protein DV872_16185 [Oceanispirochaeta sp. M1]|nr:hypothetical protein DV872_16165 [Oceanispirochaeta sp. M1]RDG30561.1 hypothetical protein DV872_16185 [Oceanispirochaeta sp. M1]
MKDIDFLLNSYNNTQELIRFTDQKVGSVLILCGIEISVFITIFNSLEFSFYNLSFFSISTFLFGLIFCISIITILFLSIHKILKPRYAKHYKKNNYSLYYFEHVALNSKSKLMKRTRTLSIKKMERIITDQLYEVSGILYKKNKYCSIIMDILFINILSLVLYVIFKNSL